MTIAERQTAYRMGLAWANGAFDPDATQARVQSVAEPNLPLTGKATVRDVGQCYLTDPEALHAFWLRDYERNKCGQFGTDDSTCETGSKGDGADKPTRARTIISQGEDGRKTATRVATHAEAALADTFAKYMTARDAMDAASLPYTSFVSNNPTLARSDEAKALRKEYMRLSEEASARYADLTREEQALNETLLNDLSVDHPRAIHVFDNQYGEGLDDAIALVARLNGSGEAVVIRSIEPLPPMDADDDGEVNGDFTDYGTNRIRLNPALSPIEQRRITIHELGHAIEFTNPKIGKAARSLVESWTRGGGQRADETLAPTKEGPVRDYSLRLYDDATEVLSTGLEMYATNPYQMAKDYPEHFAFVFDTMHGKYNQNRIDNSVAQPQAVAHEMSV